ncbi:6-phosphogluconolactonase [uncultured Kocuria sp.]|uniref:6-phosphogluconolactonase n=1 Tax=uncultured Kocuria sp. TaxID=259305 RepID=UPI0025976DB9|nr:6-phosphogluconolactonase [uncultured Kocuria sp.]MCT1368494.1 6-phosphogluconolactonase [Rothia sp. p3-SID1597]
MMPKLPQVFRYPNKDLVAQSAAARLLLLLSDETATRDVVHISITGGSLGAGIWSKVAASPLVNTVAWEKVHVWWSDERFLPEGHDERNAQQAFDAFFAEGPMPKANAHIMGSATAFTSEDAAAQAYAEELAAHADAGAASPDFALSLLGMGPDGHIASLFPERSEILSEIDGVLAIRESPKPPPERTTMTLPMINRSERIWFLVAGGDKQDAFQRLLAHRHQEEASSEVLQETPAVGARGRTETLYLAAQDVFSD